MGGGHSGCRRAHSGPGVRAILHAGGGHARVAHGQRHAASPRGGRRSLGPSRGRAPPPRRGGVRGCALLLGAPWHPHPGLALLPGQQAQHRARRLGAGLRPRPARARPVPAEALGQGVIAKG